MQNKVLEALAMGKPVVASPEAVEGLSVSPGEHLLVADSPQQWVDHVVRILVDPDARRNLAMAGRQYVEQEHRWESCLGYFSVLLGTAARPRTPA
jgi:glycosyltransferase involved in cell wall biosynthesis